MIEAALSVLENDKQRNELAAFYEQYKNRFFGIAYSKLHNPEEAEDAVQEAFLRVVDNPNKYFKMSNRERLRFVEAIIRRLIRLRLLPTMCLFLKTLYRISEHKF